MSRLEKRVQKLDGGTRTGVDIIARLPVEWSVERADAEVEAIAVANGVEPPFGMVVQIRQLTMGEDGDAEILFMGRLGVDAYFDKPLTGNLQRDCANEQA